MRKELKEIREAFESLEWAFDSKSENWPRKLLEQCIREEKSHRSGGQDFSAYHPTAPSVRDMAKLFAVSRIAEYLIKGAKVFPVGKDYLHTQTSCFIAAGMVDEFRPEIEKEWSKAVVNIPAIASLDYCHFVKATTPKK